MNACYCGSDFQFVIGQGANQPWYTRAVSDGSYRLHLNGTGDIVTLNSSGNVGIGTTSPSASLEVSGAAYIRTPNTGVSQVLRFDRSQATTGDIGQLQFYTNDGAGNPTEYGRITGTATTINNGIEKGELYFSTTLNGSLAERMRITSSGNVGIGTSSPANALHVNSGTTNEVARFESTDGTAYLSIMDNSTTSSLQGIGSAGDNLTFYANGGERMRIDSSGNLKLTGLSNGTLNFAGGNTSGGSKIQAFNDAGNANGYLAIEGYSSEYMRIDSSGNVGIGTSSPALKLSVNGDIWQGNGSGIEIGRITNASGWYDFGGSSNVNGAQMSHVGTLRFLTASTERMRIDSSGNVGIGVAPARQFHMHNASGDNNFHITNSTTGSTAADGFSIVSQSTTNDVLFNQRETANMRFFTANNEKMRIDSSGNLLVGKTSADSATDGVQFIPDGISAITRSSGEALRLTRNDDDGEILRLQKDGATVGSITTHNGRIGFGGGVTGLRIHNDITSVLPYNPTTGANQFDTVSLGHSATRFKDLYLSGSVVLDEAALTSQTTTTATTSQTAIATFAAATYGSAEVLIQAKDGSNRHLTKLLITHNGTTAIATEYGTVVTSGNLATYEVDINSGNVRVLATPASTNSTVFKMTLELIEV